MKITVFKYLLACLLPLLALAAKAETNLSIPETYIVPGEEIDLPVFFDADKDYVNFQTDIRLPEGVEFVLNRRGNPTATLNSEEIDDHTVSSSLKDGYARFVVISMTNSPLFSGNYRIMSVKVKVSEDFKGQGGGELFNSVFTYSPAQGEFLGDRPGATQYTLAVEVGALTFDKSELTVNKDADAELSLVYTPAAAEGVAVEYASSDPEVTVYENGVVKGLTAGKATISATAQGKTAVCEVTVNDTTGIDEIGIDAVDGPCEVYDINGRLLLRNPDGKDLRALPAGNVYLLHTPAQTLKLSL